MPGVNFVITGDNDNIIEKVNEVVSGFESMSRTIRNIGMSKNSFDGIEMSMEKLNTLIQENEEFIEEETKKLNDMSVALKEATAAGDVKEVQRLGMQMMVQAENIQGVVAETNEYKKALEAITPESEKFRKELEEMVESTNNASKSMDENAGIMVKLLKGQENYNAILSQLPAPLRTAVKGLNGMVGAAKAFIATPLGAILAAIILAYKSLTTWLNKSAEGQAELARISGYLQGILAGLQQTVMDVGKALYNAFTDPLGSIKRFGASMEGYLMGRLKAVINSTKLLGQAFERLAHLDFKGANTLFGDAADALIDGSMSQKIADWIQGVEDIGRAESDLNVRRDKLRRERNQWENYDKAQLEIEKDKLRNKLYTGSDTERKKAAQEYSKIVDQIIDKEIALAEEEYNIQKSSNNLTDSSLEQLEQEGAYNKKILELEARRVSEKRIAERLGFNINKRLENVSEALTEIKRKRDELLNDISDSSEASAREASALGIAGMKDGFKKEMAEIDNEHEERLAQIEKQYNERIKKVEELQREEYKKLHDGSTSGFVFNASDPLATKASEQKAAEVNNEETKNLHERTAIYKKYLDEYKDFTDKWGELTDKFNNDRLALLMAGADKFNPKIFNELNEQEREAFEQLAESWAKSGRDSGLTKWFEELSQQSLADLEIMLSDLENEMDLLGENLPENELKKLKAQILLVNKAIKDGNYDDNTKKLVENAENATVNWADLNKVLTDTAALFKEAGDAIGGKFGESLKLVGNFTTSVSKIGNAAEAYKEAAKEGDKIGKITSSLTIAGAAVSIFSEIAGRIKEAKERTEEVDRATKAYQRTLKQIHDSKILESFTNAFGTDTFGQFVRNMTVVREAGNSISSISKSLAGDTTTIKNWGKALAQSALGPLGTLFGIGTAAKKGKTVTADLISDMRTGWQKLWGSDKNIMTASISDFFDSNGNLLGEKLQEWYKAYGEGLSAENKAIVEDMLAEFDRLEDSKSGVKSYLSSMFGDIASDISSDMVDSFIETGDVIQDMSKYMNDFGKSVAKSIVQSKLMNKVFEGEEDAIADMLAAGQTSAAIDRFNELMQRAKEQAPEIEAFLAGLDLQNMAGEAARTASSKSSLGASQESIDESNGRLTAIQAQVFQMTEVVTSFKTDYERIIATTAATLQHTQGIHVDTTELKGMVSEMRELSRSVNRNINEMVDKGVKMK